MSEFKIQPPEQFQVEDLRQLVKLQNNANWSQMG